MNLATLSPETKAAHYEVYQKALRCGDADTVESIAVAFDSIGAHHTATDLFNKVDTLDMFSGGKKRRRHRKHQVQQQDTSSDDDSDVGFGCGSDRASVIMTNVDGSKGLLSNVGFGFGHDEMGLGVIIPSTYIPPTPPPPRTRFRR